MTCHWKHLEHFSFLPSLHTCMLIWETIPSLISLGFSPVFKKLRYSLVTIMWIICIVPCVVKLHPLCRTEWKRGHRVFHNISTESLLCTIIMCCYLVCILKWDIENEIWSFLNLTKYSETHYTIKKILISIHCQGKWIQNSA